MYFMAPWSIIKSNILVVFASTSNFYGELTIITDMFLACVELHFELSTQKMKYNDFWTACTL